MKKLIIAFAVVMIAGLAMSGRGTVWSQDDDERKGERSWGTPVDINRDSGAYKLVEHKGEFYLHLMGIAYDGKILGVKFGVRVYEDAEGRVYSKEQLAEYLPKQSQSSRQGTDKEIRNHDCRLDSVVAVRMLGREYIVTEAAPAIEPEHRIAASQVEQGVTVG